MIIAAFMIAALSMNHPEPGKSITLTAGPAAEDMRHVLLETAVAEAPEGMAPVLKEAAAQAEVPCQLLKEKKEARLVWLVPALKKGENRAWELSWRPPVSAESAAPPRVRLSEDKEGPISVFFGADLFTRYLYGESERKPYLYPINLGGVCLTRHFPMKAEVEGEKKDHPHQRSLWFTHGEVNQVDFWSESPRAGRVVHKEFTALESGPVLGRLGARAEWIAPGGKKLLEDAREYRFIPLVEQAAALDLTIVLTAPDEAVVFGDTKEGSFGIRLAESMKEERGGRIENARGQAGEKNAWGKPAEWIDYTGPIAGKTFGVAILDHPSSFRHPTHWHVRGYGLFAANPFGYRDFYRDQAKDGSYRLEKGASMTFRYRVIFHSGATQDAAIAEIYRAFASPPPVRS